MTWFAGRILCSVSALEQIGKRVSAYDMDSTGGPSERDVTHDMHNP